MNHCEQQQVITSPSLAFDHLQSLYPMPAQEAQEAPPQQAGEAAATGVIFYFGIGESYFLLWNYSYALLTGRPPELDEKLKKSKKKKEREPLTSEPMPTRQSKKKRLQEEESVLTSTDEGVY
ncbi:DExH-box ATP-dependent RNA helicase DExH13 [Camellia lanceoleosa]|nr:DExH-box ATP-dependent RNA helicase DExH13 [Camellia lanceoleosa]